MLERKLLTGNIGDSFHMQVGCWMMDGWRMGDRICSRETYWPFVWFAESVLGVNVIVTDSASSEGVFIYRSIMDDD